MKTRKQKSAKSGAPSKDRVAFAERKGIPNKPRAFGFEKIDSRPFAEADRLKALARTKLQSITDRIQAKRPAISPDAADSEPVVLLDQQSHILRWKLRNAEEDTMESMPPIVQRLMKFDIILGTPTRQSWLFLSYGDYAVQIHKGPRIISECRITLHTRYPGKYANLSDPIAEAWTEEFNWLLEERALAQYERVLCGDFF